MDTGILDHKVGYSEDFIKILKTWFYTHTYTHTYQNDEVGELGVSQANISFFDFFIICDVNFLKQG